MQPKTWRIGPDCKDSVPLYSSANVISLHRVRNEGR